MQSTLALSMLVDGKLEMSDQNACRFYNRIAYMNDYNGLVLDDLEANKIVDALGNKDILFLACHGVIVVGKDVSNAWEDLYYLDRACRAQLLAMQTGKPLRKISDEIALKVSKQVSEETLSESSNAKRHLESLRKILGNEGINEFNVNSCTGTVFNGITIVIDFLSEDPDTFNLLTLRSFGESFYHHITDSALEFGYVGV